MPVKINKARRVEVAPGVVNYELTVIDSSERSSQPKIDHSFAREFRRLMSVRKHRSVPGAKNANPKTKSIELDGSAQRRASA